MKAVPRPRAFTYFSATMGPVRSRQRKTRRRAGSSTYLLRWTQIVIPGLILIVISVVLTGMSSSKESQARPVDYDAIREELVRSAGQ